MKSAQISSKNFFFQTFPLLVVAECKSVLLLSLFGIAEYNTETATGIHETLPLCLNEELFRSSCRWMHFETLHGGKRNSLDKN